MDQPFERTAEHAAAFQKMWSETATRILQAAFTANSGSPPPEVLRQIRSGIFQALAQSWDEFMRSPEFLQNMRQWMENAISFRKATNDFMARLRNDVQAPSRDDMDTVMLNVRHMEKRILDRLDEMAGEIAALRAHSPAPPKAAPHPGRRKPSGAARAASRGKAPS